MFPSVFGCCIKLKIAIDSTPTPFVSFLHKKAIGVVFLRPISSIAPSSPINSSNQEFFTLSYLINSCGLSPEIAISASEKLNLETPERPDQVLNLLRTHGFTKTQISKVVKKRPHVLLAHPEKTLLPKLYFFQSIGVSTADLARTLSFNPTLLFRSLENQIIPSYNFLKSVLQSDKKVVSAMKRGSWMFLEDHTKQLAPNIEFLREFGVPESCIALLLVHYPEAFMQEHDQFRGIVNEVKGMGFDPLKSTFVLAVHAVSGGSNKSIWDRCYESYRHWGWSKDEILSAFKKHPNCMIVSEKKITRVMDFLVNKMGWHTKDVARFPFVLLRSLEKRIVPRCSVIRVLSSKGLVKKDLSLASIVVPVEKLFLERFVTKYEEQVPQLLSVYQGKMGFLEL